MLDKRYVQRHVVSTAQTKIPLSRLEFTKTCQF